MLKLKLEVLVYSPKERKYITHVFGSEKSVREFIVVNQEALDNYEFTIVQISRSEILDLEEFGL